MMKMPRVYYIEFLEFSWRSRRFLKVADPPLSLVVPTVSAFNDAYLSADCKLKNEIPSVRISSRTFQARAYLSFTVIHWYWAATCDYTFSGWQSSGGGIGPPGSPQLCPWVKSRRSCECMSAGRRLSDPTAWTHFNTASGRLIRTGWFWIFLHQGRNLYITAYEYCRLSSPGPAGEQ